MMKTLRTGLVLLAVAGCGKADSKPPEPTTSAPEKLTAAPAIGEELHATTGSEVAVLEHDGTLTLFGNDSARRWRMSTGAKTNEHKVAIGPNGILYVRSDKDIQAVTPEGLKQWTVAMGSAPEGFFPGLVPRLDSAILAVDGSGMLVAIGPDGQTLWRWRPPKPIATAPAPAPDSTTFVRAGDILINLGVDGVVRWPKSVQATKPAPAPPAPAAPAPAPAPAPAAPPAKK